MSTADLAIVIAGYGAFVGTGSLGWQVYVWRRKLRADVRVEVTHSVERGLAAEHGDDVVRAFEHQIEVAAVNAGETVEHLKSLRIENPDGERLELHERRDGDVRLEPRSRHLESLRVERTHLGLAKGFRAVAELASGAELSSDQQLDQRVLMDAKTRQD